MKVRKQTIWSIRESPRWDKQDNLSLSLSTICQIAHSAGGKFVTNLKGEVFPARLSPGEVPPPCNAAPPTVAWLH